MTSAPTAPRAAPLRRAVAAQAVMELRLLLRNGESLLVTLGIPLGILVFFSTVDVLPTEGDPVTFLVPGVLAISVMSTGLVAVAIQTGFERKYAVLKRLGATPLPRAGFLVAKALAVLAVLALQTVASLAIAVGLLGWDPGGSVAAVAAGMVAGGFTFTAIGLLLAGTLRAEATLALSNALYLGLLLISGLAFDAEALPGPVAAAASALPSGALGAVLRGALDEPATWAVGPFAVLVAWGALAAGAASRWFRWEP